MSKYWNIYIFTASSKQYAEAIVDYLDPQNRYINGILHRDHCTITKNGFVIKDLRIVHNINLKKTIIVDNLAHCFGF